MDGSLQTKDWQRICALDDITPNTGVAALYGEEQIALFRVGSGEQVHAIANYDPNSQAAVLSRGIIGSLGERIVVASPIYKQHFDLKTGECLEAPQHSVHAFAVRVEDSAVWVSDAVFTAGNWTGGEGTEDLSFRDPKRNVYKRLVLKSNRIVGALLHRDIKDGPWYRELIQTQTDVSAIRSRLLFGQALCKAA